MKYPDVRNYINGQFVTADLAAIDVFDPAAGLVISRVPMSGVRELDAAVAPGGIVYAVDMTPLTKLNAPDAAESAGATLRRFTDDVSARIARLR
mgnify:CR=1 FL=1